MTWKFQSLEKINSSKNKTMIFSKTIRISKESFKTGEVILKNTKEYKYLGITIHKKNWPFNPTLNYIRTKTVRALYDVNKLPILKALKLVELPILIASKLFEAIIRPNLFSASEVWEPFVTTTQKTGTGVKLRGHSQFLKQLLRVNWSTTMVMVRRESNKQKFYVDISCVPNMSSTEKPQAYS